MTNSNKREKSTSNFSNIVSRFFKDYKEAKEYMSKYPSYFKPGRYRILVLSKAFVFKDKKAKAFIQGQIPEEPGFLFRLSFALRRFLSLFLVCNIKGDDVCGKSGYGCEYGLVTYDKNLKLFAPDKNLVYNLIMDEGKYRYFKEQYSLLSPYFLSTIVEFNDEDLLVVEKLIDYIPPSQWSNDLKLQIINNYFKCFKEYLGSEGLRVDHLNPISNKKTDRVIEERVKDFTSKRGLNLEELSYPYLTSLGDFRIDNVLYDGKDIYYIDLGTSGRLFFLFDFLKYISDSSRRLEDYFLMDGFFEGLFDKDLKEIFQLLGLDYSNTKKDKMEYILIYLTDHIIRSHKSYEGYIGIFSDFFEHLDKRYSRYE